MNILLQVQIIAAGVNGPALGDNANTIVTVILPAANSGLSGANQLRNPGDSLGKYTSVVNQATRQSYMACRVTFYALHSNAGAVFWGGQRVQNSTPAPVGGTPGVRLLPGEAFPALGNGLVYDINLGDFDFNAATSGDSVMVIAEVL